MQKKTLHKATAQESASMLTPYPGPHTRMPGSRLGSGILLRSSWPCWSRGFTNEAFRSCFKYMDLSNNEIRKAQARDDFPKTALRATCTIWLARSNEMFRSWEMVKTPEVPTKMQLERAGPRSQSAKPTAACPRSGEARTVASLSLPGGQDGNISSIFPHSLVGSLIFPQNFFIFFLILVFRVGGSPTRESPGYATGGSGTGCPIQL